MNTWIVRVLWVSLPVTAGGALADCDAIVVRRDAHRRPTVLLWIAVGRRAQRARSSRARWPSTIARHRHAARGRRRRVARGLGRRVDGSRRCSRSSSPSARACSRCAASSRASARRARPTATRSASRSRCRRRSRSSIAAGRDRGRRRRASRPDRCCSPTAGGSRAALALAVGWPAGRSSSVRLVHQLSRRWVVLVPAGIVIADPLTLTDPVLFVRERVMGIGPADPGRRPPADALDLRLGAVLGSCAAAPHRRGRPHAARAGSGRRRAGRPDPRDAGRVRPGCSTGPAPGACPSGATDADGARVRRAMPAPSTRSPA